MKHIKLTLSLIPFIITKQYTYYFLLLFFPPSKWRFVIFLFARSFFSRVMSHKFFWKKKISISLHCIALIKWQSIFQIKSKNHKKLIIINLEKLFIKSISAIFAWFIAKTQNRSIEISWYWIKIAKKIILGWWIAIKILLFLCNFCSFLPLLCNF